MTNDYEEIVSLYTQPSGSVLFTTLSELVANPGTSRMQVCCDEVVQQSEEVRMNVNGRKTKEMLIRPIATDPPQHLLLCDATVDRVTAFRLLGIRVSSDLKWTTKC